LADGMATMPTIRKAMSKSLAPLQQRIIGRLTFQAGMDKMEYLNKLGVIMKKNIEVEVRGLLTKEEYNKLIEYLDKKAQGKEVDDRKTTFFLIPEKTLKVSEKISQGKAKVALKIGELTKVPAQTELEFEFHPRDFETVVDVFKNLGFTKIIPNSIQKRINYSLDGACISVKWSREWGYHFEIDCNLDASESIEEAHQYLRQIAHKLGVNIMSEKEFARHASKIEARYGNEQLAA